MGSVGTEKSLDWSTYYNVIDGKLTTTAKTRHGINPATGKPNPEVPVSTREDVDNAMTAGTAAYKKWSQVPFAERQKAVVAFADAVEAERGNFAKMLTQEQGKPVCLLLNLCHG